MELSNLAKIEAERNAWKTIEKLAKGRREKELFTFSRKRIDELADIMVETAKDEMDEIKGASSSDDEPSENDFL